MGSFLCQFQRGMGRIGGPGGYVITGAGLLQWPRGISREDACLKLYRELVEDGIVDGPDAGPDGEDAPVEDAPTVAPTVAPTGPELGSVSTATMRPEDLIPAFCDILKQYAPDAGGNADLLADADNWMAGAVEDAGGIFNGEESREDHAAEIVDALFDALNEIAPEGAYFGAHPGDGSDYGYWMGEDFGGDEDEGDCAGEYSPGMECPDEYYIEGEDELEGEERPRYWIVEPVSNAIALRHGPYSTLESAFHGMGAAARGEYANFTVYCYGGSLDGKYLLIETAESGIPTMPLMFDNPLPESDFTKGGDDEDGAGADESGPPYEFCGIQYHSTQRAIVATLIYWATADGLNNQAAALALLGQAPDAIFRQVGADFPNMGEWFQLDGIAPALSPAIVEIQQGSVKAAEINGPHDAPETCPPYQAPPSNDFEAAVNPLAPIQYWPSLKAYEEAGGDFGALRAAARDAGDSVLVESLDRQQKARNQGGRAVAPMLATIGLLATVCIAALQWGAGMQAPQYGPAAPTVARIPCPEYVAHIEAVESGELLPLYSGPVSCQRGGR